VSLPDLASRGDPPRARKEAFLAAATEMVNTYGYRGASVDRISAQLNRTKGAFYHHNADKDAVIEACFERTFEMMRRAAERAAAAPTGWERLALAAAALAVSHSAPAGRMLRTYSLAGLPASMRSVMVRRFAEAAGVFAGHIADGVADGSLRPVHPAAAAQMVMATVNSSAYLGVWAPEIGRDNVVPAYVRPALMGVLQVA
jgi:AcrR family transcriptional regulator